MKYCSKCGAQIDDDALFCTKCGEKQSQVNVLDVQQIQNTKKLKSSALSKVFVRRGIVIACIVLAIVFVPKIIKNSSEKAVVTKFLEALTLGDADMFCNCIAYSDEYVGYARLKNNVASSFESMKKEDYKFKGKILSIENLTDKESREFWASVDDGDYSIMVDKEDVGDLTLCEVEIFSEIDGDKEEAKVKLYIGRYNGKCKIICMDAL